MPPSRPDRFLSAIAPVHQTMRRLVNRLARTRISYAIIGGMAVCAHGHRRTTFNVDMLLTADGFAAFQRQYVPRCYEGVPRHDNWFDDLRTRVCVKVLLAGWTPRRRFPVPLTCPDPAAVSEVKDGACHVNLRTLIELKLASGRHIDLADVVALANVHGIDATWAEGFHPLLQPVFFACLDESRREAQFLASNG